MRSVPEWIGKTDDDSIPPRVRLRIFDRFDGRCRVCSRRIGGRIKPEYDHAHAIANGGENRESNIQLLCDHCHGEKTRKDIREKSQTYRKRLKHVGIKTRKGPSIPGSKSSPFKKKLNGTVERRS